MSDLPIVIVGGGVAGLAMANALAARRISSIVIEKTKSPGEIDRGDVLHRSTLLILKQWGIYEKLFDYTPLDFTKFQIMNSNGDQIFRFDIDTDLEQDTKFTVLRHPVIERFLEEAAINTGLVEIRRGVLCTGLIFDNNRVTGITTSSGKVASRLTIIANGAKSLLSTEHFKGVFYYDYPVSFYNARYKSVSDFNDVGLYVIGKDGTMILVPLPNKELRIGLQYSKLKRQEKISSQNAENVIRLRLKTFPAQKLEFIDAHIYPITMSLSNSLWTAGAVLVGDSAHTIHPIGGQGMNLAFQDAEMLAQHLADVGKGVSTLDEACKTFSDKRHKQLKAILMRIHFLAQWSLVENSQLINLREKMLKLASKSRFIKRLIFQRIVDVR